MIRAGLWGAFWGVLQSSGFGPVQWGRPESCRWGCWMGSLHVELIPGSVSSVLLGMLLLCLPLGFLQNVLLAWPLSHAIPWEQIRPTKPFLLHCLPEAARARGQPKSGGIASNSISRKRLFARGGGNQVIASSAAELAPARWVPPAPWCLVMWLSPVQPETGVLRKSFNVIASHKGIKAFATFLLREQRRFLNLC